jgi:hypothetical protein
VLLEGASTNLATYSGDTSNAVWTVSNLTKTSGQADPLGGTGAAIASGSGTNLKIFNNNANFPYTAGVAYTGSYFVKDSSSGFVQLTYNSPIVAGSFANFDLSGNGSVTRTGGSVVAQIFKLANGWYRISLTVVAANTIGSTPPLIICIDNGTTIRAAQSTGTHSITAWGCNVVAQDFLSSYINSVASASSRVGDVFRAPVGAENVMLGRNTFGVLARCDGLAQLSGGSNTLSVPTYIGEASTSLIRNSGGAYPYNSFANDTIAPTLFRTMDSGNITTPFAVALTQDATGRGLSARGSDVTKQSTFTNPAARIDIGERNGGSNPDYRGYKTVAFGPTRLSDAQLIALSGTI